MELKIVNFIKFKKIIKQLINVVEASSIRPILECFYFTINQDEFKIIAANDIISVKRIIDSDIYQANASEEFILNARVFDNIISNIDSDNLTISKTNNNTLQITTSNSEYVLNLFSDEEYPLINFNHDNKEIINLLGADLIKAIKKTIYASSEKDSRIILNGINIKVKDRHLIFTGTDSYRIARYTLFHEVNNEVSETVHIKAMKEIYKLISENEEIKVSINADWLFIETTKMIIKSKVIDGIYPNVDRVFPKELINKLTISRRKFISAIESVLVINNLSDEIAIQISKDKMLIKNNQQQIGNAEIVVDEYEYQGAKPLIKFSVNPKFLLEALKSLDKDEITLQINDSFKPIIINSEMEKNVYCLIQPLKT